MKTFKKIVSLMLAVMMLAMCTVGFAESTSGSFGENKGQITISGVGLDAGNLRATYSVYRMLDLETFNTAGKGSYSYKVNSAWTNFFATDAAKAYMTEEGGYMKWTGGTDEASVAAFAKLALNYAKTSGISPIATAEKGKNSGTLNTAGVTANVTPNTTDNTTGSLTFSGLDIGYYLVDSTIGVLCGLTTTNLHASIVAKNVAPTIDKQVQEDSTNNWGSSNTADIGQDVFFTTTINVHAGAENYVLHDQMSEGLTFRKVSKIEHIVPGTGTGTGTTTVDPSMYTVKTSTTENPIDCTFEVEFTQAFCDSLKTNDKIIVYYSAMLNRNAVYGKYPESDLSNPEKRNLFNINEAWLAYGDGNTTLKDQTLTYTFAFDLVKTDSQNTLLDGAEFTIHTAAVDPVGADGQPVSTEVGVVYLMDSNNQQVKEHGNPVYRRARPDEEDKSVTIVVTDGIVRLVGFDNGTYYLQETKQPDGYNILTSRQEFIISDTNKFADFTDDIFSSGSGVHVVNNTGTMLPETGGIGTTLFYVIGGVLAVAAVVLLVTKKRMNGMD